MKIKKSTGTTKVEIVKATLYNPLYHNSQDGYVMSLAPQAEFGNTGAGKTILLHQIIGTHPKKERVPARRSAAIIATRLSPASYVSKRLIHLRRRPRFHDV